MAKNSCGFSTGVTDGRTDGPTDGQTDQRTDKPSYRDAFLTDASKKRVRERNEEKKTK